MKNVTISVKGNIATATFDLSKSFGKSASGKTTIVATTGGNQAVSDKHPDIMFGLNVYSKGTPNPGASE